MVVFSVENCWGSPYGVSKLMFRASRGNKGLAAPAAPIFHKKGPCSGNKSHMAPFKGMFQESCELLLLLDLCGRQTVGSSIPIMGTDLPKPALRSHLVERYNHSTVEHIIKFRLQVLSPPRIQHRQIPRTRLESSIMTLRHQQSMRMCCTTQPYELQSIFS